MSVQNKVTVDADFKWKNVVIGADLDAIEFAHDNNFFLIKNRGRGKYIERYILCFKSQENDAYLFGYDQKLVKMQVYYN